jgi:hypothetical protein
MWIPAAPGKRIGPRLHSTTLDEVNYVLREWFDVVPVSFSVAERYRGEGS